MAVANNNTRIMVMFSNDEMAKLKKIALSENRSVSNLVNTIVKQYLTGISEDRD